jgi:hypothetical protein
MRFNSSVESNQRLGAGLSHKLGKLDLAVTNTQDNTVSILTGNGDGTFTPGSTPSLVPCQSRWLRPISTPMANRIWWS